MAHRMLPAVDRVLARCVEGELFEGTPCWVVTRALDSSGYGSIADDDGIRTSAHRVTYKHFIAPIPEGLELDHRCRVRACANPWHTEPVTHAENMARNRLILCQSGHSEWVLRPKKSRGGTLERLCWPCQQANQRRYRERKKAARNSPNDGD
jgi:hypothetical protein